MNDRQALLCLALLISLYLLLAYSSMLEKSVTIDEFAHLPAGLNTLNTGDFRYCSLNPPLMNMLSAFPLWILNVSSAPPRTIPEANRYSFWNNGYRFMHIHHSRYHDLFLLSRTVTVIIIGFMGLLVFFWARMLVPEHPNIAGLLSAGLIWLSPNMLAHARLVTTDAGVSFFIMLSLFTLFLLLRKQTLGWALLCGISLGLAQLVKFTSIYLYLTHLITVIVFFYGKPGEKLRRMLLLLLASYLTSIVVINAGYGFQGSCSLLGNFSFQSSPLQLVSSLLPSWIPLPLPRAYVLAFDQQLIDSLQGDASYLLGKSYYGGRWYYFVVLFLLKTPLPLLLLTAFALYLSLRRGGLCRKDEFLILFPALLIFVVFSFFSNKQIGLRMILPALALLWFWVGTTMGQLKFPLRLRVLAICLFLWFGVESLLSYPHYLPYFNQFAGGSSKGYRYAVDSNLDWGQDLPRLKGYMERHHINSIQLLYFGRVDPEIYGIVYELPSPQAKSSYLAISRSFYGRSYFVYDYGRIYETGPIEIPDPTAYQRVATLGYTIDVYKTVPQEK